jgi:hypothetical protein
LDKDIDALLSDLLDSGIWIIIGLDADNFVEVWLLNWRIFFDTRTTGFWRNHGLSTILNYVSFHLSACARKERTQN